MNHQITIVHKDKYHNECGICGKKLKTEVNLKKHISYVHDGRKTFKCSMCEANFVRSGSLKAHIS